MKHEDRRKEAGKMFFIDVSKHIVTVGIIGNILSERMSVTAAAAIFMVAIISFVIGFYTIPPRKEKS